MANGCSEFEIRFNDDEEILEVELVAVWLERLDDFELLEKSELPDEFEEHLFL